MIEYVNRFITSLTEHPEMYAAGVVIGCKVITIAFPPPQADSRLAPIYRLISKIALNIGWAVNRVQPGLTGVMVDRAAVPEVKKELLSQGVRVYPGNGSAKPDQA